MGLIILAVDDSRTIRDMLRVTLEAAGHRTLSAEDGQDGMAVLHRQIEMGELPDAIITDINMPRLDGLGFIRQLRQLDPVRLTPVLVLSTESADALKAKARDAGATGWIVKPFDPEKLVQAIDMVAG